MFRLASLALVCACLAATSGCSSKKNNPAAKDKGATSEPAETAASATVDRAAELAESIVEEAIPVSALEVSKDGEALLYLADKGATDIEQIAALRAMRRIFTWSSVVGTQQDRPVVDERYHSIVARHLQSSDIDLQAAAVDAAFHSQKAEGTPADITSTLIDLANTSSNKVVRVMALHSIHHPERLPDEAQDAVLKHLMSADPELTAATLFAVRDKAYQLPDSDKMHRAIAPLLGHTHACVRGLAASTLPRLNYGDSDEARQQAVEQVRPLLADKDGFVAASAMSAMSFHREYSAIPALLAAVERTEPTECKIEGWTHPNGTPNPQTFSEPGPVLGYGALVALQSMTYKTATEYERPEYDPKMDMKKARKEAEAWYRANQSSIGLR